MSNKVKNNLIIVTMFIILIATLTLRYTQYKTLVYNKKTLNNISSKQCCNNEKQNNNLSYSDIINKIKENSCIKIKKVINNNDDDKIFSMNVEFTGDIEQLDKFILSVKNEKKLYEIRSIQVSTKDSKMYNGDILIDFSS